METMATSASNYEQPKRERTMTIDKHYETLESYVKENEGTRVIKKVLIANNGISAVKAIRSIRRWAYMTFGNERVVEFVAMATPEDLRANAEYIRMADEVTEVPGGSNVNNYANVNLIVQLALRYAVDAVWAGWGHASENPALPNSLLKNDIVFIGPPGGPMHALGDKIGSTIIAQSAKVPTIAWNGQDLMLDYQKAGGNIPDELYQKANVTSAEQCLKEVKQVGVPVMIKASEGGGGKGIRKVTDLSQVEAAFRQVQSEIPGSPIFVMKLAPRSRHLEVQLLCDAYGNAIALSGRDCSVQRRHQKILEEGPPLAAPPNVWKEMCAAAVRLAKEVGYVNAGTVEYLYTDSKFYFLELNPRLQVEHPVTEMITGVNLPAAQLQVAMGVPLYRIADIRRLYGLSIESKDKIDFDAMSQVSPDGHVIAARITAENPNEGFQPTSGQIQELNFRSSRNVWGYFSVDSSGRVHEFADSQIGHLFAWGSTREHARRNLVMALNDLSIRGDIRTTVEYLKDLIEAPDYRANQFDTAWLDERIKANVQTVHIDNLTVVLVGAGCMFHGIMQQAETDYLGYLQRGQLPPLSLLQQERPLELIYQDVKYKLVCARSGPKTYTIMCNNSSVEVEVRSLADGGFLVLAGGKSHVAYSKEEVGAQRFVIDGQTVLFSEEYDPTQLRAQMGGKLLRYLVEDGARVAKDTPFAEVEVMKMNMPLLVKESGTVHFSKTAGAVMEPGDLLCTMKLDDPSKVKRATLFDGSFPDLGEPWPMALGSTPHIVLRQSKSILEHVMQGYMVDASRLRLAVKDISEVLANPLLPVLEVADAFSFVKNTLPLEFCSELRDLIAKFTEEMTNSAATQTAGANLQQQSASESSESPTRSTNQVTKFCDTVKDLISKQPSSVAEAANEIVRIATAYQSGLAISAMSMLDELLTSFLDVEARFAELELSDDAEKDDEMQVLRREYAQDLDKVYQLALSHNAVKSKNKISVQLLQMLESYVKLEEQEHATTTVSVENKKGWHIRSRAVGILRRLAALTGSSTSVVALEARQLLIELQEPSYQESLLAIEQKLRNIAEGDVEALGELINSSEAVLHKLIDVVADSKDQVLRGTAMDVYVRRVYNSYSIQRLQVRNNNNSLASDFEFFAEPQESMSMGIKHTGSFDNLTALLSSNSFDGLKSADRSTSAASYTSSEGGYYGSEAQGIPVAPDAKSHKLDMRARGSSEVGKPTSDSTQMRNVIPPMLVRKGILAFFATYKQLQDGFAALLGQVPAGSDPVNVVHVMLSNSVAKEAMQSSNMSHDEEETPEDNLANVLGKFMLVNKNRLQDHGIRRVTFAVASPHVQVVSGHGSGYFTYRHRSHYQEDRIVRHIETPLAFQLDLARLANFNITLVPLGKSQGIAHAVHVYHAVPKSNPRGSATGHRYFVRAIIRQTTRVEDMDTNSLDAYPGPERVFVQALAALEAVQGSQSEKANQYSHNHIFLNMLGNAPVTPEYVEGVIGLLYKRYAKRLVHAHVTEVELKVNAVMDNSPDISSSENSASLPRAPVRIIASNPTGYSLRVDTYVEAMDPHNPSESMYYSISDYSDGGVGGALAAMGIVENQHDPSAAAGTDAASDDNQDPWLGELHGKPLRYPYPVMSSFDERRVRATLVGTCFVYDFPVLFQRSLEMEWKKFTRDRPSVPMPSPSKMVSCEELVLTDDFDAEAPIPTPGASYDINIATTKRPMGRNKIAMVAWKMTLCTPQYPEGRVIIVIANDITTAAGSFGTREDEVFDQASKYARYLGAPRIYIAANSGARIGMADEVKRAFKVKWVDPNDQSKGFDYIYLDEEGHKLLGDSGRQSVITEPSTASDGSKIYKITDVIGEGTDLGVENLRGSGTIAGETSRAYDDVFTLTYVSGRTVGIGAYLVRLGQRTIQKGKNAPILLTGYQALNSLMGKDVYTSNLQLGGPKVMYNNGVSHQCVRNDLEGVGAILTWLGYVPHKKGARLPLTKLMSSDTGDRAIAYVPSREAGFDPRELLTGKADEANDGQWLSGFFDRGSFTEYLAGWAKTVIVGRACLGGIPMGVVISETRTVEAIAPADPAAPDSEERVWQQAGQVWFPDSAYKTAQAIRDFNNEGIPLMLFANWRGFSGGQRDMFDEVLKYGSFIVDALVSYKQPIFVYIPPYGELRGGAWVVVDPTINQDVMEMYAAPEARGNVLEPSGAVSIKFRKKDVVAAAHRLDPKLKQLDAAIKALKASGNDATDDGKSLASLKDEVKAREADLLPIYHQVALHFADLHDRPGRMEAKGVIRATVPWPESRGYFMWRLRRRLQEMDAVKQIMAAHEQSAKVTSGDAKGILARLLDEASVPTSNDRLVHAWLDSSAGKGAVESCCKSIRAQHIADTVKNLGLEDSRAVLKGLMGLIGQLGEDGKSEERDNLVHTLRRGVFVLGSGKKPIR